MKKRPIIFVIEDSEIVSELLAFNIEKKFEAHVLIFGTCEGAMRKLIWMLPDLILLDYNLDSNKPNMMNGLRFLEEMKIKDLKIPVIILSGQREKAISVALLKLDAVDYVSKNDDDFLGKTIESIDSTLRFIQNRKIQKKKEKRRRTYVKVGFVILFISIGIVTVSLLCT